MCEDVYFVLYIEIFIVFLFLLPFGCFSRFHVFVHPFSSGIHGRPYVEPRWCPWSKFSSLNCYILQHSTYHLSTVHYVGTGLTNLQVGTMPNTQMAWGERAKKNMWINCGYWWHNSQTQRSKHLSILSL